MKTHFAITAAVTLCLSLLAGSAVAATTPGWSVGAEGGATFLNDSSDSFTPPGNGFHSSYETGWLGGLTLGYLFANGLRVEVEVRHAENDYDKKTIASGSFSVNAKIKTTALMGNAWYNFNPNGSWHPYVGAGIGVARLDFSTPGFSDNLTAPAYQVGAGIAWDFTDRLTGDIGYRFFATEDTRFADGALTYNSEYKQHVVLASLRYNFRSRQRTDADGDGVPDTLDQCPNTPHGVSVDSRGCPLDADADGVPDYKDQCPDTPAGARVDGHGCPLVTDSDGDGVPDTNDQCPNTPANVPVMTNGCAVHQSLVLKGVRFLFNRATLTPSAKTILAKVVDTLKDSPNFDVRIDGYTDSLGSAAYNLALSGQRAAAVKHYLVAHGINADRLTTTGHGEDNPIAPNTKPDGSDNPAGRAQNRRVEMTPTGKHPNLH